MFDESLILDNDSNQFWVLIDPDKQLPEEAVEFGMMCEENGVDVILVGTSLTLTDRFEETVKLMKQNVDIPLLIFPASVNQITPNADGILFLSLISGRNPQYLIDEHVKAAPLIKSYDVKPISVGYMLIESGSITSVNFMSNTRPLPRNKPEITIAHSLAAEYLGMKMVYLEGGSGAKNSVPETIIKGVKESLSIPIMVGGGISSPDIAEKKVKAGADIVIIGTDLEKNRTKENLKNYYNAIKK